MRRVFKQKPNRSGGYDVWLVNDKTRRKVYLGYVIRLPYAADARRKGWTTGPDEADAHPTRNRAAFELMDRYLHSIGIP